MSAGPDHQHTQERRSRWDGVSVYWRLSHRPENGGELKLWKAGVRQFLDTDFFLSDDVLTLVPVPADGIEYIVRYSYCDLDAGNLPGTTYWEEGDGDDTTIGGWLPAEQLIAEENGVSFVGYAGGAGGFTLPLASGAAAGASGSISVVSATTGVRRSYSYFVATLYLQKASDGTLWKLVNAVRDSSSGVFVTGPVLMAVPTLIGSAYVRVAPSNNQIAYCFDTGAKANTNVYKTINGGASWTTLEVIPGNVGAGRRIIQGVIHPTNPDVVYTALNGNSADGGGIYKTINGGSTWTRVLAKTISSFGLANVIDMDPNNSNYIAYCDRNAGEINVTTDAGATWSHEASVGNVRYVTYLTSPLGVVICVGNGFQGRSVYKSTDGGVTWANFDSLTFDPTILISNNESYVMVGNRVNEEWVSYQATAVFAATSATMLDAIASASAPRLLVGIRQALPREIYRSFDGVTWTLFWSDGATNWSTISCV